MEKILLNSLDSARIRARIEQGTLRDAALAGDIEKLLSEINRAELVEPHEIPPDVVTMNSIVKVRYLNNDREYNFQIVYPESADFRKNRISVFAPIGTALLGYRAGDIVSWKMPGGEARIQIEEIIYQPESAGDYSS